MVEYRVYDDYDFTERKLLGIVENRGQVDKLANERVLNTDGECWITVEKWVDGKFERWL